MTDPDNEASSNSSDTPDSDGQDPSFLKISHGGNKPSGSERFEAAVESHINSYEDKLGTEIDYDLEYSSDVEIGAVFQLFDEDEGYQRKITVDTDIIHDVETERIARLALHGNLRHEMARKNSDEAAYYEEIRLLDEPNNQVGYVDKIQTVGDISTAYTRAMQNVQENTDLSFDPPELLVGPLENKFEGKPDSDIEQEDEVDWNGFGYRLDAKNNYIEIDSRLAEEVGKDLFLRDVELMVDWFYDESLQQAEEEIAECLDSLYSKWDTETIVKYGFFESLEEGTIGRHLWKTENGRKKAILKTNNSKKKHFDPNNSVYKNKMNSNIVHELSHSLENQNSPEIEEIRKNISSEIKDDDDGEDEEDLKYKDKIWNAPKEIISTFESALVHPGNYWAVDDAINDPSKIPDFFENYHEIEELPTSYENIRNPYTFALFTALSYNKGLIQEHGVAKGMEKTRDWLLNDYKDIETMKETIEESFELQGLSSYPEVYRQTRKRVERSPEPERILEEEAARISETEFERPINHYLEGSAVINIAEEENLLPRADLGDLYREVSEW